MGMTGSLNIIDGTISGTLSSTKQEITGALSNANQVISGRVDIAPIDFRETYDGEYVVVPKINVDQTLETKDKVMEDDVLVLKIPYYETSNEAGGTTVYIAMEI